MKKLFSLFLLLLMTVFPLISEPISWTGKEFGREHSPAWLTSFLKKGDNKLIRKKFNLATNDLIFIGNGKSDSLNDARYTAEANLYKKILEKLQTDSKSEKTNPTRIIGLERLYDYWEKDGEGIYSDYVVYVISHENWKKNLAE